MQRATPRCSRLLPKRHKPLFHTAHQTSYTSVLAMLLHMQTNAHATAMQPCNLCRGAPHNGRNGAPLGRHELGQVQQLLILVARPLGFLDRRVQPFKPGGRSAAIAWQRHTSASAEA
jgi:hypothetical protein